MDRPWAKRVSPVGVAFLLIGCVAILFGCARFDGAVDFTADLTAGRKPLSVRFAPVVDGSIRRWVWSFGDGQTSTERSPEHTYVDTGTYTVLLTVFPRQGDPVTVAKADHITVTSGMGGVPAPLIALDDTFNIAEMSRVSDARGSWYVFDVLANDTSPDPLAELTILGVREDQQSDYATGCVLDGGSGLVLVSRGDLAAAGTRVLFMENDAAWGLGDLTFSYLVTDGWTTAEATVTIEDHDFRHPL